jgi:hypothetical protein
VWSATWRLAVLLACAALATSRLGLIAHELLGHGGAARLVGGRVVDVELFWFAGGWIRYEGVVGLPASLVVQLGGIVVELILGVGVVVGLARRRGVVGRLAWGAGAALVVHAGWYLSTGAWHGYGDGLLLYRVLGPWRAVVAIAGGLATCAVGGLAARRLFGVLRATIPGPRRRQVVATVAAVLSAAALHAGLAVGEVAVRADATYAEAMQPERERVIAQELARWTAAQAAAGRAASPRAQAIARSALEDAHRTWPFAWVLGALLLAAVVAGAAAAPRVPREALSARSLIAAGALAAVAIGLVVCLGAALAV